MTHNTRKLRHTLHALMFATGLSLAAASHAAPTHTHEAHAEHGAAISLQLNAGKKWETDAALRQAMGNIRQAIAASLPAIHENRLPAAGYAKLAGKIEAEVGSIVANCKLAPEADVQLHLVVAELLAGAEQMSGKIKKTLRQGGAVKVIGALENYAGYFADPQFKPITH